MRDLGGVDDRESGRGGGGGNGLQETPFGLTKVYCDYLPRSNDGLTERLEAFFNCGKIIKLLKKNGKTNGYVIFKKPNSVRVALQKHDEVFEGRRLRVETPRGLVEPGAGAADDQATQDRSQKKNGWKETQRNWGTLPQRQIYVGHLAKPVNEEILRQVMVELAPSVAGDIENVKFMGTRNSCFVTLRNTAGVQALCAVLNGHPLLGQNLVAVPAEAPGVLKGVPPPQGAGGAQRANTTHIGGDDDGEASDFEEVSQKPMAKGPQRKNVTYNDEDRDEEVADERPRGPRRGNVVMTNPDDINTDRQRRAAALGACRTVLAGMFPDETRPGEIRTQFAVAGRVLDVHMVRNKVTGAFTGVAAIKFDSAKSVLNALDMDGKSVQIGRGVTLSVELDASAEELNKQSEKKNAAAKADAATTASKGNKNAAAAGTNAAPVAATTTTTTTKRAAKKPVAKRGPAPKVKHVDAGDSDDDMVIASDDEGEKKPAAAKAMGGKAAKAAASTTPKAAAAAAAAAEPASAPLTATKGKKKVAKKAAATPRAPVADDASDDDIIEEVSARAPTDVGATRAPAAGGKRKAGGAANDGAPAKRRKKVAA